MTNGEVWDAWFGVRDKMVSVFVTDTVRPTVSKRLAMAAISIASPSADIAAFAYGTYLILISVRI